MKHDPRPAGESKPVPGRGNQPSLRHQLSAVTRTAAQLLLGLAIVALPWRLRLTLASRPMTPIYGDFTDLLLFAHDALLLGMLLCWAGSLFLRPRRIQVGPFILWVPMLGLTGAAIVSVIASGDRMLSALHVLHLLLMLAVYLFVVNEIERFQTLLWAFGLQLLIQGVIAIAQIRLQSSVGLVQLGEHVLDPAGGSAFVWAESGLRSLRAYGLSDHPNIAAVNLALAMMMVMTGYLSGTGVWRVAGLALISLGSVALLLTFARPAWIALAFAAPVAVVLSIRTGGAIRISDWKLLIGVPMLLALPIIWINMPYFTIGSQSATIVARMQQRLDEWEERQALSSAANELFISNALTGVGMSTLPSAMRESMSDFAYDYQPARLTILNIAAETGLMGALFYSILLLGPWLAMGVMRDRLLISPALAGLSGTLMAITVFSFLDAYTWTYPSGRVWQWLVWGLWAISYRSARRVRLTSSAC